MFTWHCRTRSLLPWHSARSPASVPPCVLTSGCCVPISLRVSLQHFGQQPQCLPTARGFDAFLGLPFSVDDGLGIVEPATCPNPPAAGEAADHDEAAVTGHNHSSHSAPTSASSVTFEGIPMVGAGASLGPSLPLPLIRQAGKTESMIVEQPTNLRLLNQVRKNAFLRRFIGKNGHFTKTGSGQT